MIWILFAVLFTLGSIGFYVSLFYSTFEKPSKKEKIFNICITLFTIVGVIGFFIVNWRVALVFLFSAITIFIIVLAFFDGEGIIVILCIFTAVPAVALGLSAASHEVDTRISDYTLESEIDLVSLADDITVDVNGRGTRRYVYVQSESENAYTYRYETTSDIDGSRVYKKEIVTGNVEEKEVENCTKPVLKTYVRYTVSARKNFYTNYVEEVNTMPEHLYVFVVPTGSIQKNIDLK